ncbi:putative disease resistance protein At5g66900 isoform X2 [Apium graveolens]|uniref:putative disease resistance protein At5g66900 isoform X2 n=1 Tax=Apium graveolens TaxID=4045 RepID=UPI003D7AA80A
MELIAGGVVGAAISESEKSIYEVIKTTIRFKSSFNRLKNTFEEIIPILEDTERLEMITGRAQQEIDFFKKELKKGTDIVLLCSKIKQWNLYRKYVYAKKIQSYNELLTNFFQINVPLHHLRATKQATHYLSNKIDLVKKEILDDVHEKVDFPSSSKRGCGYVGDIPELVVGLDSAVEELKVMLLKENVVVQPTDCLSLHLPTVVLISAPPGCGKTTLANMVCLDSTIKGLDELLEIQDDEDAMNQLGQLLKKIGTADKNPILLVLDNVWSPGLEHFVRRFMFKGIPGYKILVTSRFISKFHYMYELNLLNDQDAEHLLRHLVSPGGTLMSITDETLNKVVKACNGFPLAITVVGLSHGGKPEATWKTTLDKWSKGQSSIFDLSSVLLKSLKTSLDALCEKDMETVKEGFLDLGCFPKNQRISSTILLDMWVELYELDEDGMYTYNNLLELSYRNLLNVVATRKDDSGDLDHRYCDGLFVTQHDMLRELAIYESYQEAMELRKRLIIEIDGKGHLKDWVEMLKKPLTARLVSISTDETFTSSWPDIKLPEAEVLILNCRSKKYTLPQFMEHMNKLKVLIVTNYGFSFSELHNFLVVRNLSSLTRIRLEHVSIFTTSSSGFAFQLMNMQKLSLTRCEIGKALNFSTLFPNLVDFKMEHCGNLTEVPVGICDIVPLEKISITRCKKLRELPDKIGKLTNLKSLRLNNCTMLETLPESISCLGGLQELRLLDLSGCVMLRKMPTWIGYLQNLRILHMKGCLGIFELPTSVKDLQNLVVFCDEQNAALWELYPNIDVIQV